MQEDLVDLFVVLFVIAICGGGVLYLVLRIYGHKILKHTHCCCMQYDLAVMDICKNTEKRLITSFQQVSKGRTDKFPLKVASCGNGSEIPKRKAAIFTIPSQRSSCICDSINSLASSTVFKNHSLGMKKVPPSLSSENSIVESLSSNPALMSYSVSKTTIINVDELSKQMDDRIDRQARSYVNWKLSFARDLPLYNSDDRSLRSLQVDHPMRKCSLVLRKYSL